MTAAVITFFWVLSAAFMFWAGLKLGQNLSRKDMGGASRNSTGLGALEEGLISS